MNDQELERRRKWEELKSKGSDPFSIEKVNCDCTIGEVLGECRGKTKEQLEETDRSLIGRIVSIRQSFAVVRDKEDTLQLYFSDKLCSEESLNCYQKYVDVGDFVYVKGTFFVTKTGTLTMRVADVKIISKCLNPFPSEYYGIQNDELKVRNRVGRALVDRKFYSTLATRAKVIFFLRQHLVDKGYLEFETPILDTVYGGANAVPFVTKFEALKQDFFLRIAPEIALKKAVIAGFPKVFEIGKVFRNEGIDHSHNPEFTSLEIYTVNAGLEETMDLTEELFRGAAKAAGITSIKVGDSEFAINKPFRRVSMFDLVKKKTGLDFYNYEIDLEQAKLMASKHNIVLDEFEKSVGHIFHKLFDALAVDELVAPTFVTHFHKDVSPLSKTDPKNPEFTLRYELYVGGVEYSNGFAELNDPDEQRLRFEKQQSERQMGNKEAFEIDESFLFALKYGLPPTGGIGIGVDRLVMLLTNQHSIKDVLFIPQIKK